MRELNTVKDVKVNINFCQERLFLHRHETQLAAKFKEKVQVKCGDRCNLIGLILRLSIEVSRHEFSGGSVTAPVVTFHAKTNWRHISIMASGYNCVSSPR